MTFISLADHLREIYHKRVTVRRVRVVATSPIQITLEVEIQPEGEEPSKTYVEITL